MYVINVRGLLPRHRDTHKHLWRHSHHSAVTGSRQGEKHVVSHEIGHMFGLKHCQWLQCVMQGSDHLEESDRHPLSLYPICLWKLQSSVGFKITDRYKALLQWVDDDGGSVGEQAVKPTEAFQEYKQWLLRCLTMLE